MNEKITFQCHIKVSTNTILNATTTEKLSLTFMGQTKTIDENGEVIFDCELSSRDKNKSFLITLNSEEYIIGGTGKCNAIAHRNSTNPFCLMLNKDDEANINSIRIYKEQNRANSNEKEQIDIYTAQIEQRSNTTAQQSNTDEANTSQTPSQEYQNIIYLESHLTSGKNLKKDIYWAYYVKYRDEPLWDNNKITKNNLYILPFTQKSKHNTQVGFNINTKFKYTIKEKQTQKEVEDYLQEKQQLIIFAYKHSPAYQTTNGQTHTILHISTLPIVEITNKTLKIFYDSTNVTYNLIEPCDTHYLSENLNRDKVYILKLIESNLCIKDKQTNKDIVFILTKTLPIQKKQMLLNLQNLEALRNTLSIHKQNDNVEVWVEVKLSRWDRIKIAYQRIDNLGKSKQDPIQKAKPKYELVGGEPYDKFKNAPHTYKNTCALRMSYALNYGGIPITKATPNTKTFTGGDKKLYVLGSKDIRDFLYMKWKYQKPYNPKSMDSKQENKSFYRDELLQFNKNGIVVMIIVGWEKSAYGHTTLWDGKDKKFIDDSNYLLDDRDIVIVRQFYFWELK